MNDVEAESISRYAYVWPYLPLLTGVCPVRTTPRRKAMEDDDFNGRVQRVGREV